MPPKSSASFKLLKSRYALNQAAFILRMTWMNTVAYFCQID